jgi:hypothetical protein
MARYRATFDGERRTAGVTVHFTPTEREQLAERATRAGAAMGEYVRELCLRRRRGSGVVAGTQRNPDAKLLADHLCAIGNNLNQLTRVANQTGELRHQEEIDLVMREMKVAMARVIAL